MTRGDFRGIDSYDFEKGSTRRTVLPRGTARSDFCQISLLVITVIAYLASTLHSVGLSHQAHSGSSAQRTGRRRGCMFASSASASALVPAPAPALASSRSRGGERFEWSRRRMTSHPVVQMVKMHACNTRQALQPRLAPTSSFSLISVSALSARGSALRGVSLGHALWAKRIMNDEHLNLNPKPCILHSGT
jgi:hypothetical protein